MVGIHLLGPPRIEIDHRSAPGPRGRKAWGLLAFLLLSGRPSSRERLAGLLFGDADAWRTADLVTGTPWADIDASGRRVRAVWGRFALGEDLGERVSVPGTLDVRRVR